MSTLPEQRDKALANVRARLALLNQMIATGGNDEHIQVVPVPVQYKIGVQQKAGSSLTEEEFEDLLSYLNLDKLKL